MTCSCFQTPKHKTREGATFKDLYAQLAADPIQRAQMNPPEKKLTISANGMPLTQFLRYITDQTGASIIADKALDAAPVTIDAINTTPTDLLSAVARRLGADLTQQGDLYYIGALKPEDRAVMVRKVRRLGAEDLDTTVKVLLSEIGRCAAYPDGLLVVGDRVRVLQRINTMIDQVEDAQAATWIIQLYLITTQDTFSREIGFQTDNALSVAANFATGSTNAQSSQAHLAINSLLRAARTSGNATIIAEPLLLLLDGGTSKFQDGETVPIPQKTVSENGAVSTNGYSYVQTGLVISTSIRELSATTATCNLAIDLTSVTGYVQEAPIVAGQKFTTTAALRAGGVYLLGSLSRKQQQLNDEGQLLPTLFKKQKTDAAIQVWCRCFRIAGPISKENQNASN